MKKKQISMLVGAMFAGAGILATGAAHAASSGANFVDRGNPNQTAADCIDGARNSGCIGTRDGENVATSDAKYTAGNGAVSGSAGIAIGDRANANYKNIGTGTNNGGAIAIGTGAQAVNNSAIAFGTVAVASGNTALAMGRQSAATGNFSTAIGNVSNASGERSVALGNSAQASGDQAIAIGSSTGTKGDGVSPGAYYDGDTNTQANGKRSLAIGSGARTNGDDQVAIGANSVGANANTATTFGQAAPVGGAVTFGKIGAARQLKNVAAGADDTDAVNVAQVKNVQSGLSTAIGNVDARVTTVNNSLSTSIANTTTTLNQMIDAKTKNAVKYTDDSHTAISLDGQGGTTISNVKAGVKDTDAVNVGQLSPLKTSLSTATSNITNLQTNVSNINTSLSTTVQNVSNLSTSVTNIGSSLSTAVGDIGGLKEADKRNVKYDGKTGFDSVTLQGANGTKISNLADGVANHDAANVGQLKSGLSTTLNQANTYTDNSVKNLSTSIGDSITTQISNLSTSVTNQIGAATKNAVQYDGDDHSSVTLGGANAQAPVKLTNVARGDVNATSTDAVNGAQLYETQQQIKDGVAGDLKNVVKYDGDDHTSVTLGKAGVPVTVDNVAAGKLSADSKQAVNGSQLYATNQEIGKQTTRIDNLTTNVSTLTSNLSVTNQNVSDLQDADKLNVKYDDSSKRQVTLGKGNGAGQGDSPVVLTNIAEGGVYDGSKDAINGSQLHRATSSTADALGGGAKANTDGSISAPTYNVGGGSFNNVGDALSNIDGRTTKNTTDITNLQASDTLSVKYDSADKTSVTFGGQGAASPVVLKNVAAGSADTDAVNVKQLNDKVAGAVDGVRQDALLFNSATGSYDATRGGSATKITNVADGVANNDAVNVGQLNSAIGGVGEIAGKGWNISTNGGAASQVKPGATVDFSGDSNIRVSQDGTNVKFALASNVTADQFSAVDARTGHTAALNGSGLQVQTQHDGNSYFTSVLGDNVSSQASYADGSFESSGFSANNVSVQHQNADGSTRSTGIHAGSLDLFEIAADGKTSNGVTLDADRLSFMSNGQSTVSLSQSGLNNGGNVISNVAAGSADTDAVNVKQLKAVQDAINDIGDKTKDAVMYDVDAKGNRVFVKDANGNNAGLISLGGSGSSTSYVINNVAAGELSATSTQAVNGSQLNATNTRVTNVENRVTNIENKVDDVANGKAGLVQQQDPNGQITVGKDTGGTSVNFSGTSGDRVLTGVGAGVNANDAVNKGQLDAAVQGANQAAGAASDWIKRADAGSFGTTATATGANSVAVGQGSVADRDNSFSVGAAGNERQITNVAAGTAPTDAVNVKQLNDNIAAGVGQSKNYTDQRVGQVYRDMDSLRKDMYGGVASAMALANLPQSWKPGRGIVGAGVANYQGRTGFAAGWSYVTENDKWVVKAAVTGNDRSGVGGAVSAGFMY